MELLQNNDWFQAHGWMVASVVVALAVAWFCYQLLAIIMYPRDLLGSTHPFERQRRDDLRKSNFVYRLFEPVVDEVAGLVRRFINEDSLDGLRISLLASREKLP